MTVELTPLGVACNLSCTYCYQTSMRDSGNYGARFDVELMKAALLRENQSFTMFGGEALLTPIEVLEELWALGKEKWGNNNLQTNGALITDAHVALFKKYAVHVGFSIDGPDELNDSRWAGSVEKTRAATARSQAAIERLFAEGVPASMICTLHRLNAGTPELRARLKEWFLNLVRLGLRDARLHALEMDHALVRHKLGMTNTQKIEAFLEFAAFEDSLPRHADGGPVLRFDIFRDIDKSLEGDTNVTCVWRPCDPYTTSAVQGIDGLGNKSNCGRTNKDGVSWLKGGQTGYERQLALHATPQEHGGCKDCRFFMMCNGNCPGMAIDGDWRNRSEDCTLYKALFEQGERRLMAQGKVPTSLAPDREAKEAEYVRGLATATVSGSEDYEHGDRPHGDHWDDAGNPAPELEPHGDAPHGDAPHGDAPHGDHNDQAAAFVEALGLAEGECIQADVR